MIEQRQGWLIINENHPNNPGKKMIYSETFRLLRKECIDAFIFGTSGSWNYWRKKYNFKCVKAQVTIKTLGQ